MNFFKKLWKSSKEEVKEVQPDPNDLPDLGDEIQIPKIIHQIWIGDEPMPEHCVEFIQQMQELNPDYEYRLWGNEIFDEVYKDDVFLKYYRTDPTLYKWAFIADRIRLLLLRDYGGIYVDVDAKPIQSFNLVRDKLKPHHNIEWANGCRMFSDKIIEECDNDVALFNYKYFYDNKITDNTVVLHDVEDTRLISWAFDEEDRKKENW